MAIIHFFTEDITFKLAHPRKTASWITAVVKKERRSIKDINYIFCSDRYLLQINKDYLNHNTLTDIITFDYSEGEKPLEGEIFISIERVRENSSLYNTTFQDELDRVLIHGVLHLIGYSDKNQAKKAQMRKKEEACLSLRTF